MKNFVLLLALGVLLSPALLAQKASLKNQIADFREEYKSDFLKEERSPFYYKKEELENLKFYKPKKAFKVLAKVERTAGESSFEMPTYSGRTQSYIKYGNLHFSVKGKEQTLAVYQSVRLSEFPEYKNYLFIPFKDATCDKSTYGGGRYMDVKIDDIQNGKITIDFNKAYNPWCAFSSGYNCPIPPKENHMAIPIKAGEKKYAKAQ